MYPVIVSSIDQPRIPTSIARICGEPLLEIPQDLYIPPNALEVLLDTFQGPLDLLLYLIRKHNLNILDIPMAELTQQYMRYVDTMCADQLELAAEYLLMSALLIEIKSRMLLPAMPKIHTEEDDDPRAELVRRLLEYEQIKKAALRLNELPQVGREITVTQVWTAHTPIDQSPSLHIDDLRRAWETILSRSHIHQHHQIKRETLSVRAYMSQIMRDLQIHEQLQFHELFSASAAIAEVIVTFLAILELAKALVIEVTQSQPFELIYVRSISD
ncbi:condensin subunit ScpA [Nitrosomonas sp. PY1]|uniref:segregation and condensation protein A n=1 Tax=Nitrosomonas sp. PY1 TaxID=1803906 RepID=UPI001FC850BF|nr:ScpA family protein [Nitrosomonas sp. PY1]GKS68884.1 condensin subunit ScpA [Nitrosomonas sp. PY1]